MKLSSAKLKTLPLNKAICDGANLYFTRTGPLKGKWTFRYQRAGKKHEMGLGPYPLVSLAEARHAAREALSAIHEGKDPLSEKRKRTATMRNREALRFSEVARRYIDGHRHEWTNDKHAHDWLSTLTRLAYPILDQKPFADLTTEDILAVLEPIWISKRETAKKLQGRLKLVFGYGKTAKLYVGENPAAWQDHLSHFFPKQTGRHLVKHHRALDYRTAPQFYKDLETIETMSSLALRFTLLTASRTSEALGARPEEFDMERMLWRVPPERMKARKAHEVPMSNQVGGLIEALLRSHNAPYVFHSSNPEKPLSNMAMLTLLQKRMDQYDTTVHGLRSTFRTWAGERTNYSPGVIEFALAHQLDEKVEGAYLRSELVEPRRPLMQDWADYLTTPKIAQKLASTHLN